MDLQSVAVYICLLFDHAARKEPACVSMVTDLKKRRAQELTAENCIVPDLCEKKIVASVSTLAVDFIFFIDEKCFSVAPPVNNQNDCVYVPATTMM